MYAGLCQLNQQMILVAGPLDVNPTAVLLLQPLFLLLSPVGGTAALLPRTRTSQVSYSSPRGLPLPRLPWLPVVPFLGLAVVHHPGALGAAWSTWSRNDFHRTWTVRGEADSWVHGRSKEVPPYYAENNDSST